MEIPQSYLNILLVMTSALPLLESENTDVYGRLLNFSRLSSPKENFLSDRKVCTHL